MNTFMYEVFALSISILNLEGEVISSTFIEMPHPQTCYVFLSEYEAPNIKVDCVNIMKAMPSTN